MFNPAVDVFEEEKSFRTTSVTAVKILCPVCSAVEPLGMKLK